MTIELAVFISTVAVLFNVVGLWAITRVKEDQIKIAKRVWNRMNYIEMSMTYHGMIPLPWEVEDLEVEERENNSFKREGNVVYLKKEE